MHLDPNCSCSNYLASNDVAKTLEFWGGWGALSSTNPKTPPITREKSTIDSDESKIFFFFSVSVKE